MNSNVSNNINNKNQNVISNNSNNINGNNINNLNDENNNIISNDTNNITNNNTYYFLTKIGIYVGITICNIYSSFTYILHFTPFILLIELLDQLNDH